MRIYSTFFVLLVGFAGPADGFNATAEFECEIVDTDTDASLEAAGVNPTCPEKGKPWACYCELEEVCENKKTGQELTFHRRVLLGCGDLSDCMFFTPFGQRCDAMEG